MEPSIENLVQWCLTHGIVMGKKRDIMDNSKIHSSVDHAPFSLRPYEFPDQEFRKAISLSTLFNKLIISVAQDKEWLMETLHQTAENDDFTRHLRDLYLSSLSLSSSNPISLSINRSDYMLHSPSLSPSLSSSPSQTHRSLMQVELNTIAASFGSLSSQISEMHRLFYSRSSSPSEDIPVNNTLQGISAALSATHIAYITTHHSSLSVSPSTLTHDVCILMIVQPGERNFADQKHIEFALAHTHRVKVIRYSLSQLSSRVSLSLSHSGALMVRCERERNGETEREDVVMEVSVVYFRAGYGPEDYTDEMCWRTREIIEKSYAVKCPSLSHQLVGTKKVQQQLAEKGVLERFISDEREREAVREVFAGLYSLEGEEGERMAREGERERDKYVLKPQREGGGHNYYGHELKHMLATMSERERAAYILMQRIIPPVQESVLVREGKAEKTNCVCELGVFGVYLSVSGRIEINDCAGHLLRVKPQQADEGGVNAGYSVLSSPLLKRESS
mmetsp:Transcript_7975/g.8124  ORF Transcript_7975/g.8124 Transcript_7975/m.8124 type:complete len:505 (+) Transcript_7975:214-1728(+)